MPQKPSGNEHRWMANFSRAGFFLGAFLLHLIVFLLVATWIVFGPPPPQPAPTKIYIQTSAQIPSPPPQPMAIPPSPKINNSSVETSGNSILIGPSPIKIDIQPPAFGKTTTYPPIGIGDGPSPKIPEGIGPRLPDIYKTVTRYRGDDYRKTRCDPTEVASIFPVYVASYADGDWDCNLRLDKDGNIVAGSIPDLVAKINEWSHGKINGQVVPKPLNIGSSELLDKMPPFIFFTGHKDFVLTDQEIENLAKYLQNGGAIWGDNALAGSGSRFDVAFLREMKRVIPDKDKNFEPMSMTDDIFARGYYHIAQIPIGMNYYAEPPQHLDLDGIPAIIYTPNDYSDIMFMRVLPGDKEAYIKDEVPPNTLFTDQTLWNNRHVFYRNFDLGNALAVHRLGMNIIAYLLVRFDNVLLLAPNQ
jgi:hypothetical protein